MSSSFDKLVSSVVYECGIHSRINSRSISWNSSGTTLAMAASDRTTKLYSTTDLMSSSSSSSSSNSSSSQVRELSSINQSVDRVRFHPHQDSIVATASGSDAAIKLWDVRTSSPKASGSILLNGSGSNGSTVDISWSKSKADSLLVLTEKNGSIHVVDTRKLGNIKTSAKHPSILKTFQLTPKIVDACVVAPNGEYLVAATSAEGYGELTVWNWKQDTSSRHVYPAHTGPIYSMCFSPNGQHLATGGGDALVGLWDVNSMVCASTVPRCDRFVRSTSFSYDSQVVATSTEEAFVDLACPFTGTQVGKVSLAGGNSTTNSRTSSNRNVPGADEIAFHPRTHLLACARCDSSSCSPLTIAKLTLGRQQS